MHEGLSLASMVNNSESWINITKQDIEKLGKPDEILIRNVLGRHENPCKDFMYPELSFCYLVNMSLWKRD